MKQPKRIGHENPKLIIYLEWNTEPSKAHIHAKSLRFVIWNLRRLKLQYQEVAIDYAPNYVPPTGGKVALLMGEAVCKVTIGKSIKGVWKNYKNRNIPGLGIYVCGSPASALFSPTETYRINRVLFLAAEHAKLKPETDLTIPIFDEFMEQDRF